MIPMLRWSLFSGEVCATITCQGIACIAHADTYCLHERGGGGVCGWYRTARQAMLPDLWGSRATLFADLVVWGCTMPMAYSQAPVWGDAGLIARNILLLVYDRYCMTCIAYTLQALEHIEQDTAATGAAHCGVVVYGDEA